MATQLKRMPRIEQPRLRQMLHVVLDNLPAPFVITVRYLKRLVGGEE